MPKTQPDTMKGGDAKKRRPNAERPISTRELCNAKTKAGGRCKKPAGWGTGHHGAGQCKLHGGSTPNSELHGQLRLARQEAAVMGVPLDMAPHVAILECVRIAAGEVAYASERVAELEASQAVGAVVHTHERPLSLGKEGEDPDQPVTETKRDAPALHVWVTVRHQAMDRLVNYSAVALKAGVEERRVKLAEDQGLMIAQVIRGILTELGVLERPETPGVIRRHLALVASNG